MVTTETFSTNKDWHLLTNEEARHSLMAAYLLERESKNEKPPRLGFYRIRGKFEIPFKTNMYKRWWAMDDYHKMALSLFDQCGNKLYRMFLEEHGKIDDKMQRDYTKRILLAMETLDKEPPKYAFNEDRGFFDIPFQTEKYQTWWANGPEPLDNPTLPQHFREVEKFVCEQNLESSEIESEKTGEELERCLAIKYKLLNKESRKERPPHQGFNKSRGKFDIPFETEQYKKWWHSEPMPDEEDIDSSDSNHLEGLEEEIYLSKREHYNQKWAMRYFLMAEAIDVKPHKCAWYKYEHGSFEIPFQTELYQEWWSKSDGGSDQLECKTEYEKMQEEIDEMTTVHTLLGYESLNLDPQIYDYQNYRHGKFHIPFKTDKFKNWWNAEPKKSLDELVSRHYFCMFVKLISYIGPFNGYAAESSYRGWLTTYLLNLEAKDKNLPRSKFSDERGRFEIPFQTTLWQNWWNERENEQ